jgi:hypothetical protein
MAPLPLPWTRMQEPRGAAAGEADGVADSVAMMLASWTW